MNPKHLLVWLGVLVVIALVFLALLGSNYISTSRNSAQRSLVIGERYPVDGPYPSILKVSGTSNMPYNNVVNGDLIITLPEGSKDPRIIRFYTPGYINCEFYIEFTNPSGLRQTWTWMQCPALEGMTVIPNEIYVK